MASLFEPLTIRGVTFRNRVAVSPMCQYSSIDGFANDWHFVHLGSRAVGGAALVTAEASAVLPEGRISPADLGIWKDEHIPALARIAEFIHGQGAIAAIQLAHAGRKASMPPPWEKQRALTEAEGGWKTVAPSAVPFSENYPMPEELSIEGIPKAVQAFAAAAKRAREAGFQVIELHAAHGYLIHQFLSPLSNQRKDAYGGSFENRTRFALEVAKATREVWPVSLPLFVRISSTDWVDGGWDIEQSVQLAGKLKDLGVDLVDCSSGGLVPYAKIEPGPGYQVDFSWRIKEETGVLTGAVGMIADPGQADEILSTGKADMIFMAREFLRDPYFPLRAASEFGFTVDWPVQYLRAAPSGSVARQPMYPDTRTGAAQGQRGIGVIAPHTK
jgi:2,4-dienoyl-CoA reductase-like NADH-dependent reductase (Old Yellow Enzyme family)